MMDAGLIGMRYRCERVKVTMDWQTGVAAFIVLLVLVYLLYTMTYPQTFVTS
jgi:hypothetical protein